MTAPPSRATHDADALVASGRRVVAIERRALDALQERIGPDFARAC